MNVAPVWPPSISTMCADLDYASGRFFFVFMLLGSAAVLHTRFFFMHALDLIHELLGQLVPCRLLVFLVRWLGVLVLARSAKSYTVGCTRQWLHLCALRLPAGLGMQLHVLLH